MIASYMAGSLLLGALFKGRAGSLDGFMVAGRSIGSWLLAFTFAATYFSSVVIIVGGGWGFSHGISTLLIAAGNVVLGTLVVFTVLGPRLNRLSSRLKALTVPELIGRLHGSRGLAVVAAITIALGLWLYMVVIDVAVSALLSQVLGLSLLEASLLFGAIVAAYIALGGMYSVVWTDALQGTIMAMGVAILAFYVIRSVGGLLHGLQGLAGLEPELTSLPGRGIGWGELLDLVLVTSVAIWGLPQLINRFYTARSPDIVRRSTGFAVALAIIVTFSAYLVGALGNIVNAERGLGLSPADVKHAIPVLASALLPPSLLAVFTAAVLAASMSTMDSVAFTSSSALLYDLLGVRSTMTLRLGSAAYTLIASILAVPVASLGLTSVFKAGWLVVSGALLVPVLMGLAGLRSPAASLASSLTGALAALIPSIAMLRGIHVGYVFPISQALALAAFLAVYASSEGNAPGKH